METAVEKEFGRHRIKLVRYADDFVVFAKTVENVLKAKEILIEFLKPINLNFSEEKTRIGHSMETNRELQDPWAWIFLVIIFEPNLAQYIVE